MNPFRSLASAQMPFLFQRMIGGASKRRFTLSRFPACATPSARAWLNRWKKLPPNPVGELVDHLYETSADRCEETCVFQSQATGRTSSRSSRRGSVRDSASLRKTRWRFGGCLLSTHQHSTPVGISGLRGGAGDQSHSNVDSLRIGRRTRAASSSKRILQPEKFTFSASIKGQFDPASTALAIFLAGTILHPTYPHHVRNHIISENYCLS
jgi:hypothetical protein